MSLKDIRFDPFLLGQLYSQPLIPLKQSAAPPPDIKAPLNFLGQNQQHITLLINYPEQAFLNDDLFDLLINMLKACQLNMADVALINTATYDELTIDNIYHQLRPVQLIDFGVPPTVYNADELEYYKVYTLENLRLIRSEPLDEINKDKGKKGLLWKALQQLFNL